jgi:nicotinamide-nucleotide amidase
MPQQECCRAYLLPPEQAKMKDLVAIADKIAKHLTVRKQTIAIAESSTGGLISAALIAVPGASAYFLGGGVVYTRQSRRLLLDVPDAALDGMRPSTEPYALLMARTAQKNFSSTWGLAETGATGPTGNRYGDAAGHSCIAVAGLAESSMTLETEMADRQENMHAFTIAALTFLLQIVSR